MAGFLSFEQSNNVGILLARARRALRREFEARLAVYDLTVPQVAVLMNLWEEDGQTITELTRRICSDGPTLTSLLDRLEAKGLIYRDRDPRDRRTIRIRLQQGNEDLRRDVCAAGEEVVALLRK